MMISVITVAFIAAQTIDATMRSMVTQTHSDIEYTVIDDGSTDGMQACIAHQASRLDHFFSEPDLSYLSRDEQRCGLGHG
jgi:glycosyltransferase involved in cell wall biosynthesis